MQEFFDGIRSGNLMLLLVICYALFFQGVSQAAIFNETKGSPNNILKKKAAQKTAGKELGKKNGEQDVPNDKDKLGEVELKRQQQLLRRFFQDKYEEAILKYKLGHYQQAAKIAEAILILVPNSPIKDKLKRLRHKAEARHLGSSVLTVQFQKKTMDKFPVEKLQGTMVLENISNYPISLEAGTDGKLALCEYQVFEIFANGSRWSTKGSKLVRADINKLVLADGEGYSADFEIDVPRMSQRPVLQFFIIGGSFRPARLSVGETAVLRVIPWQQAELFIFAPDLEDIREQPFQKLEQALSQGNSRLIAAAGFYWLRELELREPFADEERTKTIDLLIAQLNPKESQSLDRLVMHLLEGVSGESLRPRKEEWLEWAQQRAKKH